MAVKFFDEEWYLARNPDVAELVASGGMTAQEHYEVFGQNEGRSPSPLFDPGYYLDHNVDVATAVALGHTTAYAHFEEFGHLENRLASPYFNPQSYLNQNPDVAEAVEAGHFSAYEHFQTFGAAEDRSPLASFDPEYYLYANPDVAAVVEAGDLTATRHFQLFGMNEGRSISPAISLGAYLAANPDVQEAVDNGVFTAWEHLSLLGIAEGRDLGQGVSTALFANDSTFQLALAQGRMDDALARLTNVAPFLPEFEAPADFQLPADWPIPQNYVHPEGSLLTVPEGWVPAEPVQLPNSFEQPFSANVAEGVVSFDAGVTGDIRVIDQNGQLAFAHNNFIAQQKAPANSTVNLAAEQILVGLYSDMEDLTITGDGAVRAEGTDEADVIDTSEWTVANLTVDAKGGDDTLTLADGQHGIGGEGADTFTPAATAGTPSVITIDDYNYEQGDVIDLSQIEGFDIFAMEVRGAEYDGTTWQWGPGYTGDSVGIWFTNDVANLQITGARGDLMKFALPEIPGFEGYDTMHLSIANGATVRAEDVDGQILSGGSGTQVLIGGTSADILSGGADNDVYVFNSGNVSQLENIDHILGLEIGTDTLLADHLVAAGTFVDAGTIDALNAENIAAVLTETTFQARAGAYFVVGEGAEARTFVALNDDTAGFDAASDTLVEITTYSGDLAALSVIGVPGFDTPEGRAVVEQAVSA